MSHIKDTYTLVPISLSSFAKGKHLLQEIKMNATYLDVQGKLGSCGAAFPFLFLIFSSSVSGSRRILVFRNRGSATAACVKLSGTLEANTVATILKDDVVEAKDKV